MKSKCWLALFPFGLALTMFGSAADAPARRWKLSTFRDFNGGHFEDSGANDYVSADGTLRLINAFDFNRDGRADAFFPSTHDYNEKVDLSIYWNEHGFAAERVQRLPTQGGRDAAVADLNRDGFPDLVVVSSFDGTRNDLEAFIYWGSKDGFASTRRTALPTQGAEAVVVADLDGDGWPDLVIANNGRTYHVAVDRMQQSYIYWNDRGAFSPDHRSVLPTINARDVAVADLNGDGEPDVVTVNAGNADGEAGARIFWSAAGKFDFNRSTFLPGERSTAVAIGDLNHDGRPDLVLANGYRLKGRDGNIYDIVDTVAIDSFIYWNGPQGFAADHRTPLPTVAANDVAIGDLDRDGLADLVFANTQGGASFVYWGSTTGFDAQHRLALPTQHANSVKLADLNGDGSLDVIFANGSVGGNYDTDSFIYWGGKEGLSADRCQHLPTFGAAAVVAAALHPEGPLDLIFLNKQSGREVDSPSTLYLSDAKLPTVLDPKRGTALETNGPNSFTAADLNQDGWPDFVIPCADGLYIYWSDHATYSKSNRTAVTRTPAFSSRVADFDRDGYLDLMLSEWEPGSTSTRILYGGPAGFSTANSTTLPIGGIRFHTIADFNSDGWIDVAFPMFESEKVAIFWNGPQGFKAANRTDLPARATVSVEAADLNGDGYLELIVPNLFHEGAAGKPDMPGGVAKEAAQGQAFGGSPDGGVFIYWGSAQGYSPERRTILPAIGAEDTAVADLNNDGRLDLVVTSYHGGTRRNFPSYIYWQDEHGFDATHVTMLETNSASGVLATDFNQDGWIDLLISNHQADGNHKNDSYIYWGSAAGFSPERRLRLPAGGPHLMTSVDHGSVRDRTHRYVYVSAAKEFAGAKQLTGATWRADTPPGTSVQVQVRSASLESALPQAEWAGATNSALNLPLHGSWVQFRVVLANPGGGLPVFHELELKFE